MALQLACFVLPERSGSAHLEASSGMSLTRGANSTVSHKLLVWGAEMRYRIGW
jgi:hypothetical protein